VNSRCAAAPILRDQGTARRRLLVLWLFGNGNPWVASMLGPRNSIHFDSDIHVLLAQLTRISSRVIHTLTLEGRHFFKRKVSLPEIVLPFSFPLQLFLKSLSVLNICASSRRLGKVSFLKQGYGRYTLFEVASRAQELIRWPVCCLDDHRGSMWAVTVLAAVDACEPDICRIQFHIIKLGLG